MSNIKISKKLSISISLIIFSVFLVSIFANTFLVDKYYIFEKKKGLETINSQIKDMNSISEVIENISKLEEKYDTIIVFTKNTGDIDEINESIRDQFFNRKIKLNKFWLTKEVIGELEDESVNKIYDQGISKYKVLTKFIKVEDYIFAVALPLPYMNETLGIVNKFTFFILVFAMIIAIILVNIISKRIVKPIDNLKALSKDIASLNFRKEYIKTNDEIEELSVSINSMSNSLEKAHNEINNKNKRLKELISNISHELKTPLALIKVYSQGIEDGLDDGTYIKIIKEQVDKMNDLIERLLFWARLESYSLNKSTFDLKEILFRELRKYDLIIKNNNINLSVTFSKEEKYNIFADEESISIVLDNLITNAIKYSNDNNIEISFKQSKKHILFLIKNGISECAKSEINNVWTPFYVFEKSRNKNLSGTGLGLPIIKSILENHKLEFGLDIKENKFEFYILF